MGAIQFAWRVARSDYALFLLMWLPVMLLQVAVGYVSIAYERAQGFAMDASAMTTGEQMEWLGVAAPLTLVLLTARVALWTFVAARVLDRADDGERLARWRPLVGPAVAAGFVLVLTFLAGAMLLLVGLFVFVHWFAYVPAMVANGKRSLGAAFDASRKFARERRTQGFTALLLLVGAIVYGAWFALGLLPGWTGLVAPAIVAWLLGPIVPLLAASYVAIASTSEPAAGSGARPVEARASTKCPKCATLIPYAPDPNGKGTEIVCPACGHAGRVL